MTIESPKPGGVAPTPEDEPASIDRPRVEFFYKVGPDEGFEIVPLADGRWTFDRQTIVVKVLDGTGVQLELGVAVTDGRVRLVRAVALGDDLPMSTLRHYKLAKHVEDALAMTTLKPPADNVQFKLRPSTEARAAVRKAMRMSVTDDLLAEMLAVYRAAGGGGDGVRAVQEQWPGAYRHRDRQVKEAMRREQEREGGR